MPHELMDVVLTGNQLITIENVSKNTELALKFEAGIEPELTKLAEKKGFSFDGVDPFFWFAEISNDIPNCYYLIFDKPMQKDWTKTLQTGVQYQLFHDNTAPVGHSIYGWTEQSNERFRTLGAFYAVPGTQINQYMSTDDFARNIKAGVFRDVSVGMGVETCECTICGADPTDWLGKIFGEAECEHWLGETYDVDGKPTVCYGKVTQGILAEVSQVYDGGAPMASVIPALTLSRSDRLLEPRLQARLESRFGAQEFEAKPVAINAPATIAFEGARSGRYWTATATSGTKTSVKPAQNKGETVSLVDALDTRLLDRIYDLEIFAEGDEIDPGKMVDGFIGIIDKLEERNKSLETDAQVGRSYKTEKIDDAIASGIRAKGNDFAAETYKAMLSRCTIEEIKQIEKDFTAEGDARHAPASTTGTRLTSDGGEPLQLDDVRKTEKFNDKRYSG
jgi:hypothetical protein